MSKIIWFLSWLIEHLPEKVNLPLLYESLTHKSYAIEQKKPVLHNQRLEFLGDSILGLIIAHALYEDFPDFDEAQMTLWKISLVREENLYDVCKDIQLNEYLLLWAGEERKGWKDNPAILADALEAFIGYIYLDLGFEVVKEFVMKYVYTKKETIVLVGNKSRKSLLQERIQWDHKTLPIYVTEESERDDSKNHVLYKSTAKLWEMILWIGFGVNKKKAEEDAAKNSLEK